MPADIIIYALVTAGLVFWLRSILGTRNGEEQERPVPYLKTDGEDGASGAASAGQAESLIADLAQNPKNGLEISGSAAENGLMGIARIDSGFDVIKFLRAAQDAFVFIVESFADGDRETLEDLLAPDVYAAFEKAITDREKAGEKMETEIVAIKKSEIIEARAEAKKAFITIRFHAEETSVTRDEKGEIISGHPEKITQMRDIWTFSRDLKSRDPRWFLVATREDQDGDNAYLPNTQ